MIKKYLSKKRISIGIGILVIILALGGFVGLLRAKKSTTPQVQKIVQTVFTQEVRNHSIPILISASGNLIAKNKVDLYSEVEGVLNRTRPEFKPGQYYKKGQTLLHINSTEYNASLLAEKSNLYNQITSMLPDLRMDFPEAYPKWEEYLKNFDVKKPVNPLPEPSMEMERFFVSGRGVYTRFYSVKNMEVHLNKFDIRAPYDGVLTEALVTQGTLVRSGQKLGEFIDPTVFEMEIAVNAAFSKYLRLGEEVHLNDLQRNETWKGKVIRVNGKIDQGTQTVQAYIQVKGGDLKEGMYLEASVQVKEVEDAFEVSRSLLEGNSRLYVVRDSVLDYQEVEPVYFKKGTVVVKGLPNGIQVLTQPVPGGFVGMPVKISKELES
ncbi:efflux RND transporter periplasmic adaptor subunit [Xanthovirga aplysinae]|uniref:efflux RND transporter periplasmic adaptor subunit n=1 Tax=Xanthovirga aplysinae TaxID=2529853 RepID=UPI0012BC695D|nr:HlyD family efflux transporter periplasmic adaptor subunit [Xanthovirga aplysinae]MTI32799.1 HlyD family efflux transporter periplasmic adaptor subunit [Xanthovirga aplysinae]